jgi:class 3 adenylate cyclase
VPGSQTYLRVGASPAVAYSLNRAFFEVDLTGVLPAVRVPTLVLYRELEQATAADFAARVQEARCVRVSGDDYLEIYLSPEVANEVATFVAGEPVPDVPETVLATVMFTDIVGSTERATALGDAAWRDLLARHHEAVRRVLARFRGQERDTAGDGFFATFDGPARAIRCGQAIVDAVEALGLQVRIGIHIGECELHEDKVTGIAVIVGARIAAMARLGQVLVSGTVRDLVAGSGLELSEQGHHPLKGLPGTWSIHEAR